ncbi:hypothetical protein AHAS_Ahas09G0082300 [Arachis hypogaea]
MLKMISLHQLLDELKVSQKIPRTIYCNNQSICLLATNPILHSKCKYIELDLIFILLENLSTKKNCMLFIYLLRIK